MATKTEIRMMDEDRREVPYEDAVMIQLDEVDSEDGYLHRRAWVSGPKGESPPAEKPAWVDDPDQFDWDDLDEQIAADDEDLGGGR